jgi:hypothetical protein
MGMSREHARRQIAPRWRECVEGCHQILSEARRDIEKDLGKFVDFGVIKYIFLTSSIEYGQQSLVLTDDLMRRRTFWHLATLKRSYFELATQVLWAERQEDGWTRLGSDLAVEMKKRAQELKDFPEHKEFAEKILASPSSAGDSSPPIPQMLREIHDRDARENRVPQRKSCVTFEYASVYRDMTWAAHANPSLFAICSAESLQGNIMLADIFATFMLCRAVKMAMGLEWSELDRRAAALMRGQEVAR